MIKEKSIVKLHSNLYVALKIIKNEVLIQQLWTDKQPKWVNKDLVVEVLKT